MRRQIAKPHDKDAKRIAGKFFTPPSASEHAENLARYGAAASLMTTPTDYARFLLEILHPKPPDAFRLNEASHRELLRPQVKKADETDVGRARRGQVSSSIEAGPMMLFSSARARPPAAYCPHRRTQRSAVPDLMVTPNGDSHVTVPDEEAHERCRPAAIRMHDGDCAGAVQIGDPFS